MSKQTRQLRIYSKAFLHATLYRRKYVQVPQIILQGQWLHDIGFLQGGTVNVDFEEGRIVVTAAAPPEPPPLPGTHKRSRAR